MIWLKVAQKNPASSPDKNAENYRIQIENATATKKAEKKYRLNSYLPFHITAECAANAANAQRLGSSRDPNVRNLVKKF